MSTQAVQTTVAQLKPPAQESVANLPVVNVGLTSLQGFELAQRAAKCLSSSTLVPKDYQGNMPNCVIALNMAARVGADPLMVMQNLVVVHGRPTWSSQFLIATVNTCGRFSALRYEFFGKPGTDEWGCRAWAIEKATGEKLVGTDVTIKIAKDEGWHGRSGSKWKTIPQQMLMYRAGSWWTRAYAPELSMGLHTSEEIKDVYDAEKQEDGTYAINIETLKEARPAADQTDNAETSAAATTGAGAAPDNSQPVSTPHNPETGEIIEDKKPAVPLPPVVRSLNWSSLTGESLKSEVKVMLDALKYFTGYEDRMIFFEQCHGPDLMQALSDKGMGMDVGKLKPLIAVPL